jgi:hypothetical protein
LPGWLHRSRALPQPVHQIDESGGLYVGSKAAAVLVVESIVCKPRRIQ